MAEMETNDETDKYEKALEQAIAEGDMHNINQAILELQTKERIDHCLSKAYHRLKLLNVPINEDIETYVVDTLVCRRFFCDKNIDNLKEVPIALDDVHERIDRLVKLIDKLTTKYPGMTSVKNLFVYMCQLTAKHLHILKHQLKSTYDKLPWTEMEFCFVALVLNIVKPEESDDIFKLVLNRGRVLQHLDTFKKGLLKLKPELDGKCINRKLRLGNRSQIVESVLTFYPQFKNLYHDYDLIKDINSLLRIDDYITVCNSLRFDDDVEHDKLVIERTLQVIGETLKSTPDSPNVSEEVQELLVRSKGKNLKEVLTALRDSLSHTESLLQKIDMENSNAPDFFERIRDDLTKIHIEIVRILFKRRSKALELFSKNVLQCKDLLEIRNLAENIDSFKDVVMCDISVKEIAEIEGLIRELTEEVCDLSLEEKALLDKVDTIIHDEKVKVKVSAKNYTAFTRSCRFAICEIRRSEDFSYIQRLFVMILEVLSDSNDISTSLCSISEPIRKIQTSVESRLKFENSERIAQLFNDILHIARLSSERASHIDKFKTNLENSEFADVKHRRYIDGILEKVAKSLKTEIEREAFRKAVVAKKEVTKMRFDLITLIDGKLCRPTDVDDEEKVIKLLKKFKLRKQTEELFITNYTNDAYDECMDTIKKIDDTYGLFIKNMSDLDLFSYHKQHKALKIFLSSLKLKKFALEDVMQEFMSQSETEIQLFITERTDVLKKILSSNGITDVIGYVGKMREKKSLKVITELILLDVMNVLQKASLFVDDKLFFDDTPPLLLGQALRKYLAHGNSLVDILPFDANTTLACNAFRIVQERERLLNNKDILIGKRGNMQLFKSKFYLECLSDIVVQNLFYATVQSNKVDNILECTHQGANIFGQDIDGQNALHFAASRDSLESFLLCVKNGLDDCSIDVFGHTPLEIAVQKGSVRCFQYYLDKPNANVDIDNMFIMAAKCRQMEILSMLLQRFCNDISTESVTDTIEFISQMGYVEVLTLIFEKFGKSKHKIRDVDALHLACFYGHKEMVEQLLSNGFDINKVANNGQLPIHAAIIGGHRDMVELLIKSGSQLDSDKDSDIDSQVRTEENLSPTSQMKVLVNLMTFKDAARCSQRTLTALCTACALNMPRIAELLIKSGADVNLATKGRCTPLQEASQRGAIEIIEILLQNGAEVNKTTEENLTAAHYAAKCGHTDVLDKLCTNGSNLNAKTIKGKTPLHIAVEMAHLDVVTFLILKGVDVNAVDNYGYSPLHLVNRSGDVNILEVLLKQDAISLDLPDNDGNTALHYAASYGNAACVTSLLKCGAYCDPVNAVKVTPLLYAIEGGFASIVATLLEHQVNVDAVYFDEHTPLHLASKNGPSEVVLKLIERGADVNALDPTGVSPLHMACSYGQADVADVLLKAGARANAATVEGYTPLYLAARGGFSSTIDVLCDVGARLDDADVQGITPLLVACHRGHRLAVEQLLVRGASCTVSDTAGATPVHVASLGGHLDVVRVLLEHAGASTLHASTYSGETVLHVAAESGNVALVRYLLAEGVSVDAVDEEGFTPMHVAAQKGRVDVVEMLLSAGAKVDAVAEGGVTALHMAADGGGAAVARVLLKAGANVEAALEDSGETALHVAAGEGAVEVVEVLVEAGAKVGALDGEGRTALERAVHAGHADVVVLLLEKGGK